MSTRTLTLDEDTEVPIENAVPPQLEEEVQGKNDSASSSSASSSSDATGIAAKTTDGNGIYGNAVSTVDGTAVGTKEEDAALDDEEEDEVDTRLSNDSSSDDAKATPEEILKIRGMLGRLQKQVAKQNKQPESNERVLVSLKPEEVQLLGELLGRGLIRAPSTIRSSSVDYDRKMTAVQYSNLLGRVRGDDHWPVNVGFKDLHYSVMIPQEDTGISTVGTTCLKIFSPLIKMFTCKWHTRVEIPVLHKMSGCFEASKSTLVLGPPGCGVTSLFKVLSGRAKVKGRYKLDGEVLYSGYTPEELHVRKLAMYVDQLDQHTAVLTVRETLQFAYDCFGGPEVAEKVIGFTSTSEHATPEEKAKVHEQLQEYPDFVIHNLALDRAKNTIVGNAMLRGVSGGEKKRVTSGEMLMARRPLVFYDQISTGLDSAATFDICRRLTGVAKNLHLTPIIALLQPPPEVYNLFDEILILAMGHIVFHGPREDVLPYFSSIGFECPYDRDIADFIQEVTTPARVRYQTRLDAPRDEAQMAEAWLNSPFSQAKRDATDKFCNPENKVDAVARRELYAKDKPRYANSCFEDFKLVFNRQRQLVLRDPSFIRARIMQSVIMGVVIGTVFIKLEPDLPTANSNTSDYTPITQRYGVIFATLMQCALAGMAQVPVVLGQRPVFYKQSNAYFFRTINYVLAELISTIPVAIVESILMASLIFWITAIVPWNENAPTGENDVGGRFMIFICIMIALNLSFAAYLRAIATYVPTPGIGQVISGISIAASVVFSGFILTQSTMPPWFIWIYWLSPIAWGYRSAVLTVFTSKAFTAEQQQFALDLFAFPSNTQYIWAGVLMLIAYLFVNLTLSYIGYTNVRYDSGGGRQGAPSENPEVEEIERIINERSSRIDQPRAQSSIQSPQSGSSKHLSAAYSSQVPTSEIQLRMATSLQNENFTPCDMVFRDLWYSVQGPDDKKGKFSLDLLKGISGYAEAGTLTALMGSSGAGKTTLLDVLALRKTSGKITGEVLINGRKQDKTTFSRIVGYVEQNDIHSPSATVEEAFLFSAILRQAADVPRHEKEQFVEGVIDTLNLGNIRNFMIGSKMSGGLTTEQVKRVTIGVELSANPAIIFADEPTSGLDANSARIVMVGLERIARAGRTVICTIHQPSKDIFLKFDRLLLLKRGGETVFFGDLGDKAKHLLAYLEAIPGTPSMPNPRYNPATYMLEAIGAGAGEESLVDYANEYRESKLRAANDAKMDKLIKSNTENRPEIHFEHAYASTFFEQQELLFKRWTKAYWRNPGYNTTRFGVAIFIALFFGLSFLQNASDLQSTQDVQSFCGLTFISASFLSVISLNTAIPVVMDERTPFYRERAASYYSVAPMIISITSVEAPYVIMASMVYVPIFYFLVHFWIDAGVFFLWFGVYVTFMLTMTFWGHFLGSIAPNQQVAGILGALSFGLWVQTAGLVIAVRDIPGFWYWLSCINPLRYMFNALVVIQLACDDPDSGSNSPGCIEVSDGITAWKYVQSNFGFEADDWKYCFGSLAGFCVGFRILSIIAYTFVSYLKR
eukprot:CAMPEP_0171494712 /NCGR_PEP_ID=MMETSP0958-20121227/5711_1 /TAXON_ID=87120 /ORGANISM="Aurantiochytrium limacinum, Strain ATCCMYA-1381" /LENGTH=1545 /DNA_ID=CAMNT_0012028559 /DNA_START=516 /DNA_END=5153 /DNA_ORIENTATION=+